jgi:photosystem II stability/assembly factor-like uncharacterized protein
MKSYRLFIFAGATLLLLISLFIAFNTNPSENQEKNRIAFEAFLHQELSKLPAPEVNLKDIPKMDRPDMAALQNYYQTLDPALGYVPFDRQYASYLQTLAQQKDIISAREAGISWTGTRAEMGGRVRAIMFDPNDPLHKKVWAAGVTGGLWYTNDITNLFVDWYPLDDFWPNLAISSLTHDPTDPLVFYAGTGEAQTARIIYRESTGLGIGIMKSTDGGDTWELLPSTSGFAYVTDIKVRDENGVGVIYAGVVSGVYQGEQHDSEPTDGLYRSADGGETWTQVLPAIPDGFGKIYAPAHIEIASNNRIFVGTMENLDLKGGATILYSDAGTGGSWTAFRDYNTLISGENYYKIPARTQIAASPSNPDIVYAQFSAGYTSGFNYYRGRYMARSTDGGQTWNSMNIPDAEWSTLAWHAFVLKVDPVNPQSVYTGGLDLWKSTNSGQSWTRISDWVLMYYGGGDEYVHADQHNIAFRPGFPNQAIFASDGGIFFTTTAHLSIPVFQERNQNFNTLQFYSCAISPTAGATQYLGGLQDNGTLRYTGNPLTINSMISGGDGAFCFWDQNQAGIYLTSVYYNSYYVWLNNFNVNTFGGNTGTFVSPADYDYKLNTLYSNAVSFSGQNPGRLLKASGIPSNINESIINLGTANSVPFSAVTYSPHSPEGKTNLFVGTQSGRLYKVTEAQSLPQSTDIGSPDFPTGNISSIAIGGSEDTLLVTFSNYGVASVWLTHDGGETWQMREGNLPDMPIRWGIFHPHNAGQAMLATENGIWVTNKLNSSESEWVPANDGLANVRVDMLRMRENDLTVLAATHGRGLYTCTWEADFYVGTPEFTIKTDLRVFPNPTKESITIYLTGNKKITGIVITDLSGKRILEQHTKSNTKSINIDVNHLQQGIYIVQCLSGNHHVATTKVVKK